MKVLMPGTLLCCVLAVDANAAESVVECSAIADDRARLLCYDSLAQRAGLSAPPLAPTLSAAAAPAASPATGEESISAAASTAAMPTEQAAREFGLSATERAGALPSLPDSIVSKVTAVNASSHPGRWIVTLENGQVWEQRETSAEARRPRPGDEVKISDSVFGSYLLVSKRGSSRVKRIR